MNKQSIGERTRSFQYARVETLHVTLVIAGLGAGGAERVISLIAGDWAARGRIVTVIAFDNEDDPVFHQLDPRIRVIRLGIPASSGLGGLRAAIRRCMALRRTLDGLNPDVTISFLTKINVLALLACLGSKRRLIISERNNPKLQRASRLWTLLLARMQWRADAIIMQTRASLECLKGAARWRARVIPNPITIDPVEEPSRTSPVLAATGRLTWQKGFDLLIDAFARVADRHPKWTLVIWGEGENRTLLQRQIDELGLSDRIRLPGNSRSPSEWVGQADAFVMSSRYEGFSNALGEAMAAGLPVVSFDCDYGPIEMIEAGKTGLLVTNGDVEALAVALDTLMGDKALRNQLGKAARTASDRYRPSVVIKRWDRILSDVSGL